MEPWQWYVVDVATLAGLLAVAALVYGAALAGIGWLAGRRIDARLARSCWLSAALSAWLVVIAVPLFLGVAGLFRYERPGDLMSGYRELEPYWSTARIAFFALYALLLIAGLAVGRTIGLRLAGRASPAAVSAVVGISAFMLVTLPVVEFMNECIVGRAFLLDLNC